VTDQFPEKPEDDRGMAILAGFTVLVLVVIVATIMALQP
jgi:hypothetical protein